jgi:hypothetical protein
MLAVVRFTRLALIGCIAGSLHTARSLADDPDFEAGFSSPSFMFEGLRSGEILRFPSPVPLSAGWQNVISDNGMVDVQHIPLPYRALRFHVLRNDPHNNPRMNFRLACRAAGIGEQSTEGAYCPAEDQFPRSQYVSAFRLELYGPDADRFDLSYRCWSARKGDGEDLVDHGEKGAGDWCGSDEPNHWVTRIVVRVRKRGP